MAGFWNRPPWNQTQSSAGNQPRSTLIAEIRPRPVEQDSDPVPKSDEEKDVNHQPGHPCQKTGQMKFAEVRDRSFATDRCHVAFIEITERFGWFTGQAILDISGDFAAHLHRHRADSGKRFAVLHEQSHIADGKNIVVTGNSQVRFNLDPPGAIEFDAE